MRCEYCGCQDVHVVGFGSVDRATYQYCRRCENGTWVSGGHQVDTTQILEVAATIEPGHRGASIAA